MQPNCDQNNPDGTDNVATRLMVAAELAKARFVLAESCSGGMAAALITQVPGASRYFCGSAVTYRQATKQKWLEVDDETLRVHSAESQPATHALALSVLRKTPEANWSAAVTGHLGPNAPPESDGLVFVAIMQRISGQPELYQQFAHPLKASERSLRQREAAMFLLEQLARAITLSD